MLTRAREIRRLLAVVGVALIVSACFDLHLPPGSLRCSTEQAHPCPEGMVCLAEGTEGRCYPKDQRQDAGIDADARQQAATFFRADSLWNTPIANEDVGWIDEPALRSDRWWINHSTGSSPVVISAQGDPLVEVTVPDSWGWPGGVQQVHLPAGVTGGGGSCGYLVVVDGNTAFDFYQFVRTSVTAATADAWAKNDVVTGSGWGNDNPWKGAGIHGAGSSGLAGEIYGNELQQGMHHALAFGAVPVEGSLLDGDGVYHPPAISSDGPAQGLRIGIPPGTAKPPGLSVAGEHVWDALSTYGAWLVDNLGGSGPSVVSFYADPRSVSGTDVAEAMADLEAIKEHVRVVDYSYPYNP